MPTIFNIDSRHSQTVKDKMGGPPTWTLYESTNFDKLLTIVPNSDTFSDWRRTSYVPWVKTNKTKKTH